MAPQSKPPTKHKPFTPNPPRSTEERLPRLYRTLTDQVEEGYFQNAIKTCKKILTLDPASQAAFQSLLFLYLQTDDYATALTLVDGSSAKESLEFERSYCLYRLHREKEALEMLKQLGERGRKVEQLEAQILYRLGDYQKAQEIYEDLLADCDPSSPEHPDTVTNLAATSSHLEFSTTTYRSHLANTGSATEIPSTELETHVPSLPTGWATGGLAAAVEKKTAGVKAPEEKKEKTKPKHKLPKGAVLGKEFTEDPERWMPLRQRASFIASQSKKKGAKESMGTGFTQGSTASHAGGSGGGGGNGKNKKGKRK